MKNRQQEVDPFLTIVSHPTGNANVRGLLGVLQSTGALAGFFTTIGISSKRWLSRLSGFRRRCFEVPPNRIQTLPGPEILRLFGGRVGIGGASWRGQRGVDSVYRALDRHVADVVKTSNGVVCGSRAAQVYGYEDGCLDTFRAARRLGMRRVYELPIGYWRAAKRIFSEEAELKPEWRALIPSLSDSTEKLDRKEAELDEADEVVVASTFTKQTLEFHAGGLPQVSVIPYGAPAPGPPCPRRIPRANRALRVLFVGSLTQRKGLSYLMQAMEQVGSKATLTLVGRRTAACPPLDPWLAIHRWIPTLSHDEILAEMRNHDVLAFPSLFEGFGLVILEALSCGLPVIATPNSAGPDLLTAGEDGFIVPIRSAEALAGKIELLADDRQLLGEMSRRALEKAAHFTWQRYAAQILPLLCCRTFEMKAERHIL